MDADVIVVGAGFSGLSAAKWLNEAAISVLVLEARDRVGGRIFTKFDPAIDYVDLGGAYLGVSQYRLLRLSKEFGVQNYKVNEVEDLLHYKNGRRIRFKASDGLVRWNPLVNMDINNLFWLMDTMGKEIPEEAPWNAPHADEWDTMTFKEFLDKNAWTQAGKEFFKNFININITTESYEASLLSFLWYVKQCGGTKRIISTTNGGQERKFKGGSQQICIKMAEKLGDKVKLSSPVVGISQDENQVKVKTLNGKEYTSRYIILALPPMMQMKIHYSPPLPPIRNQMLQRVPMGSVIKVVLYYSKCFWGEKGLCGSFLIEGNDDHPAFLTLDDTKPNGSHPAIVGFILADKSRRFTIMTSEERKKRVAQSFAEATGLKEALHPIHYEEKNWLEEQYSGGCYTAMYPPGFFTRYGKVIRQPLGRMYFAGTETATRWSGYMEGAIEAGERAAREIMFEMGKIPSSQIWLQEPPSEDLIPLPFKTTFREKYMPSIPTFLKLVTLTTILGTTTVILLKYPQLLKLMK